MFATLASYDNSRLKLGGIPIYSFLLAFPKLNSSANGENINNAVLLLRMISSTSLRQEMVKETLIQHYQSSPNPHNIFDNNVLSDISEYNSGLDPHTHSFLSFGGYTCQVLGSLYINKNNNQISFGADIEFLPSACIFTVAMPNKEILEHLIYIIKKSKIAPNENMMKKLGFDTVGKDGFSIGKLRYSATQNLQINNDMPDIRYNFDELIAQRTAVFGMTRTGKSNMIKNLVSQIHIGAAKKNIKIGQLIFDINGEYANINEQDSGSLANALGDHSIRFAKGASKANNDKILELLPDFYSDLNLGLTLIQKKIKENGGASSESFQNFMNMSFTENFADDYALTYLRKYLYRTLLNEAGYKYNKSKNFHIFNWKYFVKENKSGLNLEEIKSCSLYKEINSFEEMSKWLRNLSNQNIYSELHPEIISLMNLIRKRNTAGTPITGSGYISMCCSQHSANDDFKEKNKGNELLEYIKHGKMVIIDLSGSSPSSQIILMRELANNIFSDYVNSFTNNNLVNKNPPCLIYIEEAHNMIGTKIPIDDVWPRIAKEGSKYGLGLVYATQEPSSVQTNILSNTENFIVCHINNSREVKEICNFFDYEIFGNSIIRLQEPGYIRIKQRDMPFVIPVQANKFDVEVIKGEIEIINKTDFGKQLIMQKNIFANDVHIDLNNKDFVQENLEYFKSEIKPTPVVEKIIKNSDINIENSSRFSRRRD